MTPPREVSTTSEYGVPGGRDIDFSLDRYPDITGAVLRYVGVSPKWVLRRIGMTPVAYAHACRRKEAPVTA